MAKQNDQTKSNRSNLDFEAQLWAAADKLRGHMDASEYKHLCLGLIFLKHISDAFEEKREQLLFGFSDPKSEWFIKEEPERKAAAENRDEYLAANVFWLPPEARWHTIKAKAKSPEIGKVIDDAMSARLNAKIPRSKVYCRALAPDPASPKSGLTDSWTSSATSASTNRRRSPRTCSDASMNNFWESSPARKARAAAISTPPNASCRCSLPCLSRSKVADVRSSNLST